MQMTNEHIKRCSVTIRKMTAQITAKYLSIPTKIKHVKQEMQDETKIFTAGGNVKRRSHFGWQSRSVFVRLNIRVTAGPINSTPRYMHKKNENT